MAVYIAIYIFEMKASSSNKATRQSSTSFINVYNLVAYAQTSLKFNYPKLIV